MYMHIENEQALRPPQTCSEISELFSEGSFSAVGSQIAALVSTAKVWISPTDTSTSILIGFLGMHGRFVFCCSGTNLS